MRRSSYRLGRRLKASAKARLDYITYLQSGAGHGSEQAPEVPGRIRLRFDGGGLFSMATREAITLGAEYMGGGAMSADTREPVTLGAAFGAGGEFTTPIHIIQRLAGDLSAGGNLLMHVYPPHRLAMSAEGGGDMSGVVRIRQNLGLSLTGGGAFEANAKVLEAVRLALNFTGDGAVGIDVAMPIPPVRLATNFAGGGALVVDVAKNDFVPVNAETTAILNSFDVEPPLWRIKAIDAFITETKTAGVWAKLDCVYMLNAHDRQAAHINWKSAGDFTLVPAGVQAGAMPFTPYDTYAGVYLANYNGGYLDSGWVPATHGVNYTLNNAGIYIYSETATQLQPSVLFAAGCNDGPSSLRAAFSPRQNLGGGYGCININSRFGTSSDTAYDMALRGIIRSDANNTHFYYKGTQGFANTATTTGLPTVSMGVCGSKDINSTNADRELGYPSPIVFGAWGAALTPTEMVALDAAISTFRATTS